MNNFQSSVLFAAFALVGPACRQHHEPATVDAATTAPAPAASTHDPEGEARRAVAAWNDALTRHDLEALSTSYDDEVRYYGRVLPKATILRAKRAAFDAMRAFHQEIVGDVRITAIGDRFVASFVKRSGAPGAMRDVRAKIGLRYADAGRVLVVEETDEPSEQRHAGAREECEAAAAAVVNAQPHVKRAVASAEAAAAASHDRARFGGIGPIDDGEGGFSAGIGIHTDERFEQRIAYQVDRAGHLSVSVDGEDLTLSKDVLRSVARACAPSNP